MRWWEFESRRLGSARAQALEALLHAVEDRLVEAVEACSVAQVSAAGIGVTGVSKHALQGRNHKWTLRIVVRAHAARGTRAPRQYEDPCFH